MLSYIIITYLLSLVSALFYWLFVRNKVSAKFTKNFLIGIIAFTLLIPLAMDNLLEGHTPCLRENHPISEAVYYSYCPNEAETKMCLDIVVDSSEPFCACGKAFEANNLLMYKAHNGYDLLITYETSLLWGAFIAALIVLLLLLCKLLYLVYIVWTSEQTEQMLFGEKYILLRPKHPFSACAFQLWHAYIIWQPELDLLSESERNAVLQHEIAHVQQRDTLLKVSLHLVQMIWWMNPVYYLFAKELSRLSEFIADEFAVKSIGDTRHYASLLVKMKRYQNLAIANHFNAKSQLKIRVEHLLKPTRFMPPIIAIPMIVFMLLSLSAITHYSIPTITETLDNIRLYDSMASENKESGRVYFCKHCHL